MKKGKKALMDLPLRTCTTLHHCILYDKPITMGQRYFDGGYPRRAHEDCARIIAMHKG